MTPEADKSIRRIWELTEDMIDEAMRDGDQVRLLAIIARNTNSIAESLNRIALRPFDDRP